MARIIEFEGRRIQIPDDATPEEIGRILGGPAPTGMAATPPPAGVPAGIGPSAAEWTAEIPQPKGNVPPIVQGSGRGLAEFVGFLPDIAGAAANAALAGGSLVSQAAGGPEISYRFPSFSDALASVVGEGAEQIGVKTTPYSEMSFPEKGHYNVGRFGTQALAGLPALARLALKRAGEHAAGDIAARWYDPLVKPYAGQSVVRPLTGDAAATAGTAAGVTAADQYLPESPIASLLASIAGGVGGVTALSSAEGAAKAVGRAAQRPFGWHLDKSISPTELGSPLTKRVTDKAAEVLQNEAIDKDNALFRIGTNRAELTALDPNVPLPTPAGLSEDPGLSALERKIGLTRPAEAIARERAFKGGVRGTLDRAAPAGADPQALVDRIRSVAGARTEQATREVDQAAGHARGVEIARQRAAEEQVTPYSGQDVAASQRLDRAITEGSLYPMTAEKNRQFVAVPDVPVSAQPLVDAATDVRTRTEALPPNTQARTRPAGPMADFESYIVRDEDGNITGVANTSYRVLNDMRAALSEEVSQARASNANPVLLDNYERLRAAINQITENLPEAQGAVRHYREDYAPVWGRQAGEAYDFRRSVDQDRYHRTASPPSQTASRFLQPGQPEKAESLRRVVVSSENPIAGESASREYMLADMAGSGVLDRRTDVIRPDRLRAWATKWGPTLDTVPGFRAEIEGMIHRAERGEQLSGDFAAQLRNAERGARLTEEQINRGALGLVLRADPDKAVFAIMERKTETGRLMDEVIRATDADPQARAGLKAAVRDYLVDKTTGTDTAKLPPGDRRGPVSFDRLSKIFREHETELARIFTPEEMNTLRAGHRALELSNVERLRVSSGSDTAEKTAMIDRVLGTDLGRGIEAALRLHYGVLKTGGIIATGRRLTAGLTDKTAEEATKLVERAAYDPALMELLLGRKIAVASPRWNAKMNRIMGYGEAARQSSPPYGEED